MTFYNFHISGPSLQLNNNKRKCRNRIDRWDKWGVKVAEWGRRDINTHRQTQRQTKTHTHTHRQTEKQAGRYISS